MYYINIKYNSIYSLFSRHVSKEYFFKMCQIFLFCCCLFVLNNIAFSRYINVYPSLEIRLFTYLRFKTIVVVLKKSAFRKENGIVVLYLMYLFTALIHLPIGFYTYITHKTLSNKESKIPWWIFKTLTNLRPTRSTVRVIGQHFRYCYVTVKRANSIGIV